MVKRFQPVSLNVVRRCFGDAGIYLDRIRTVQFATPDREYAIIDCTLSNSSEPAITNYSPLQMFDLINGLFCDDIQLVSIEYRNHHWVVRLRTEDHQGERADLSWLDDISATFGSPDELGGAFDAPNYNPLLDKSALPW
jgi:hypothetical protein